MTKEFVDVTFRCRLDYETKAGRAYLIQFLKKEVGVEMGGCGIDVGSYHVKNLKSTAKIEKAEPYEKLTRKEKPSVGPSNYKDENRMYRCPSCSHWWEAEKDMIQCCSDE
jgi:hypothetical protein